ncbi:hypothetical protein [Zavarzinella formosa]|uniref:hypothetical protein n=1 Tax=Zavarzinella formosa TaxID=360055 RepID=UPI0002FDD103|nr:hypothetical protein [Zavarzinella formosa]
MSQALASAQRLRIKSGTMFAGDSSEFVGVVREHRTHESNGRQMFRLTFERPEHVKMWADCWFYADDLEVVT